MWSTWKKFWQPAGRASVRPWLTKKLSAAHIVLTIPVTKKDHVPYTLELLCLWLMNKQFNSCSRVRYEKLFIGGEGLMTITMTTSTNITTTITTTTSSFTGLIFHSSSWLKNNLWYTQLVLQASCPSRRPPSSVKSLNRKWSSDAQQGKSPTGPHPSFS